MIKKVFLIPAVLLSFLVLSGFTFSDEKTLSTAVVYGVTAVLSFLVFLVYIFGIKKKTPWFLLLFSSVFVVNAGYFALAISRTLDEALLANRISYLGSVFLPMSILMIILDVTKTKYGKWLTGLLIGVGIFVFLIAATPGYLDIYYKEVSLVTVNGVSMLQKTYGPLHIIYLLYLLIYFSSMVTLCVVKTVKKKIGSTIQAFILLFSVFINIVVWFLEQFVKIDFEILSVSYIVTEVFLLFLCFLIQENEKQNKRDFNEAENKEECNQIGRSSDIAYETHAHTETDTVAEEYGSDKNEATDFFSTEEYKAFVVGVSLLTHTERKIYDFYIEGKSTKEVLGLLDITENTLKYHNKNIYGKLGVSSRKQLKEIALRTGNENVNKIK